MILFLDIENTVIDNLTDCNWLEKNCEKIYIIHFYDIG